MKGPGFLDERLEPQNAYLFKDTQQQHHAQ